MRKIVCLLLIIACALALCGCGAEINYFYEQNGDDYKYEYTIALDDDLVNELESNASLKTPTEKWTLGSYFSILAEGFGYDYGYGETETKKLYSLSRTINETDLPDDDDEEDGTTVEVIPHFFTREYRYTAFHPLADAVGKFESGERGEGTIYEVIASGYGVLPALKTAFPLLEGKDISDLTLNFYWRTDELETNDGQKVKVNGKTYLKWTAHCDEQTSKITYSYYGVNPLGWYVVIIALGVLAVVIVWLVARKRKKSGTLTLAGEKRKRRNEPTVVYDEANFERFGFGSSARQELDDLFSGKAENEEKERLRSRIDEFFSPEEAEEIKKKMQDKK